MNKLFITLLLLSLAFVFADHQEQRLLNQYRDRVQVTLQENMTFKDLAALGFQLDRCCYRGGKQIFVYATPNEVEKLKALNLEVEEAPVFIGENTRDASYHTYKTLTDELQKLTSQYSHIASLQSVGKTVEGREMWIVKISDNVNENEAEPEFKYISSMHGDEVVGKELMIYLIRLLLSEYGKDDRITRLINHTQIWIMPSMNPDGTEYKRRYNADWVDLNRDFPDVVDDKKNTPDGRAIEVQNIMKFNEQHNFVLSINFHGGAVVVNYPWDTQSGNPPYIELVKHLSLGYSKLNTPMYNSNSFPKGITNGYDWYEVDSGMQDWNYHWYNTIELTVELSDVKWPNASQLDKFWSDNRESLLWYISQTHRGIHGTVKDGANDAPLAAKVSVAGVNKDVQAGQTHGDFYRVLLPGSYDVTFSHPGYKSKTVYGVEVKDKDFDPTVLNVTLEK